MRQSPATDRWFALLACAAATALGAGPDHPVGLAHPEGEYLKGWWAAVEARP